MIQKITKSMLDLKFSDSTTLNDSNSIATSTAVYNINNTLNAKVEELTRNSMYLTRGISINSNGTLTLDLSTGNAFYCTITQATTIVLSNKPTDDFVFVVYMTNGGNYSVTWPINSKFINGETPILTSSGVDLITISILNNNITINSLANIS